MRVNARLEDLVRAVGLPAALRLVDAVGGVSVFLPHPSRVNADSYLARRIGVEMTRQLACLWPSEEITIPRAAAYLRRERNRAIHREKDKLSIRELSLKYELTERAVYSVLINPPPEEPQMPARDVAQHSLF